MVPRRLFDKSPDDSEWMVIPREDRYPLSSATGRWGLAVCLQSALQSVGVEVGYARLMALLNTAFAFHFDPEFRPQRVMTKAAWRVEKTLGGLGFGEANFSEGTPEGQRTGDEIEAGRPFSVHQWEEATRDWSLIFGVNRSSRQWRGYLFAPDPRQTEMDAACSHAIILGSQGEGAPDEQIERLAIEDALKSFQEDWAGGYDRWAEVISGQEAFPEGRNGDEMILRHEWFTEAHLDSRDCATRFFRDLAQKYPVMGEIFAGIADIYSRLVETLETRRPPIFSNMATQMLRDPGVLSEWTRRLREAGRLEQKAMREMRNTLRMSWR